jgi:SAM-dependent methyltransferase
LIFDEGVMIMRNDFLKSLICPDCGSNFNIKESYEKTKENIILGIVGCHCSEYPILDGILIYKKPSFKDNLANTTHIIQRLRKGQMDYARILPFSHGQIGESFLNMQLLLSSILGPSRHFYPVAPFIKRWNKKIYRKISGDISFFKAMDILEPNTWGDYLKHRFSCQTLWSLYPFLPLFEMKSDMVLDLGCGAAHGSFVLSKVVPQKNIICSDENYTMLFLAKKFMAPSANFICLDANSPLPFKDDVFSSILMMDSAHYVANRALLGRESQRILKSDGFVSLVHLHNAKQKNPSAGFPLNPAAWKGLFPDMNTYVIPENRVIEDFIQRYELDLTKGVSKETQDSANTLCMLASENKDLIGKYSDLASFIKRNFKNPIINPIYEIGQGKEGTTLKRRPPNSLFFKEYPLSKRYLPEKYTLPKDILGALKGKSVMNIKRNMEKGSFKEMIEKFIILDTPVRYV